MTYEDKMLGILSVYKRCGIRCFPVDCMEILRCCGLKIKAYSMLSLKKQDICMKLSEDAFVIEDTVFYNNRMPERRIRFSLMHELGHIILRTDSEADANFFAGSLLAPRLAIHYSRCRSSCDVARRFYVSREAASVAYTDYLQWRSDITARHNRMDRIDKLVYDHFCDPFEHKFIYQIEYCPYCGGELYNGSRRCTGYCSGLSAVPPDTCGDFDDILAEGLRFSWPLHYGSM